MKALLEQAKACLDLLYPRSCVITGELPDNDDYNYLSNAGIQALQRVVAPHCDSCGHPFFGSLAGLRDCPHCQELDPAYNKGKTLLLMNKAGKELIHTFKYQSGHYLIPDIIRLAENTAGYLEFIYDAILVPIPLSSRKHRDRGYNQSLLLAEALADKCGTQFQELLKRVIDTDSQTTLDRDERSKNMKDAFLTREAPSPNLRYIIVDDVFTTGATVNAAAKALRKAGAKHIDVITLGHG